MPGVLQIEALAQAAGILAVESLGLAGSGKLVYFMAIEEAKFRAPVEPAACSISTPASSRSGRASASSGPPRLGKVTCEVQFTAMIADPPQGLISASGAAISATLFQAGRNRPRVLP